MKYVLDSFVGFKTLIAETNSTKAQRLADNYRKEVHEFLAQSAPLLYALRIDFLPAPRENEGMETEIIDVFSPEVMVDLQAAADRAANGVRDPEAMRQAAERMDRIREEIARKHGVLDIGVSAIREFRDRE